MRTATAGLFIGLARPGKVPMKCHTNRFARVLEGNENIEFTSCTVRGRPGELIRINIEFTGEYKLQGARGVRIIVAIGYGEQDPSNMNDTQSFWIDKENLYGIHELYSFSRWSSEISQPAVSSFSIPPLDLAPDANSEFTLWQDIGIANKGCIAVFAVRGDLVNGQVELRQARETDPPTGHQFKATGMPKIISPDWFKPHADATHGRVATVEFRNLGNIDIGPMASGSGETGVASAASRSSSSETIDNGQSPDNSAEVPTRHISKPQAIAKTPTARTSHTTENIEGHPKRSKLSTHEPRTTGNLTHTGLADIPSVVIHENGHTLASSSIITTNPNPADASHLAAAAAIQRRLKEDNKRVTSQQRLRNAHARKRAAADEAHVTRPSTVGDSRMKKQKRSEGQDSASEVEVDTQTKASMGHSVDLTADSDVDGLVKAKVEMEEQSGAKAVDLT